MKIIVDAQAKGTDKRQYNQPNLNCELIVGNRGTIDGSQQRSKQHDYPAHELDCWRDIAKVNFRLMFIHSESCTVLRRFRLEVILILSVLILAGQLAWPGATRWWGRPRPGTVGIDQLQVGVDGIARDYVVYLPRDIHRGTWPLVVFLHGSGQRGNDPSVLFHVGPFAQLRSSREIPAIVVGPQCRHAREWSPNSVAEFVELLATDRKVDRDRIYLVGYSMGGYGAWATAAAYPELFASLVPICGGGEPGKAFALSSLPVWAFHGAKDDIVPLFESQQMINAIHATGAEPKLTVLPDMGHGICEVVFRHKDLWNWLLANRRSTQINR